MICIYEADCTDFSTNGLGVVLPTSCEVTETLNGEWELTLEHPIDDAGKWQRFADGRILRAPVPAAMTPRVQTMEVTTSTYVYKVRTSGGRLNLRSGTGTRYKVLASYKKGTEIIVLNKTTDSWYEVSCPDGKHGYMHSDYLEYVRTNTVTTATGEVIEPRQLRDQPFRIYRIVPELTKVTVYARHIFYDLLDNMLQTVEPGATGKTQKDDTDETKNTPTGIETIQAIDKGCLSEHCFTFYSDIDDKAEDVKFENINPVDALLGDDGYVSKYKAELARDWYDVFLVKRVGRDTDVQIRQGKNLTGISYDVDGTNVTTRIMPTGEDKDGNVLYLPEIYVDSPNINAYVHPKWIHLAVSDAKEVTDGDDKKSKDQCYAEMRKAAQEEFDKGCDLPDVTLNVEFVSCENTEEYAQYAALQYIYLGDAVRVIARRIGVSVYLRMTQYTYDCLLKRYTKVTLGTAEDAMESSTVTSRQIASGSITGSKLALNSVGSGQLQSGSVGALQVKMAAIETAHIRDAAITNAKIADASIDAAKIKDASIGSAQIGNAAIGTANIQDAAITQAKIAKAAIGSAQIQDAAIGNAHIENGVIDSAKIGEAAVQTAHIEDAAITKAKIAKAAIGSAQIEDAAIKNAHIENGAIDSAKIGTAAIGAAHIQDGAIGTAKIVDAAITKAKIANLAVGTAQIDDLAVTTAKIAEAAIGSAQIKDAAIETAKIALGAITAALIQDGAIGTAQIADASITDAKVVSLNADVITAGTLSVERLLLKGPNGLFRAINATDAGLSIETLSQEQYQSALSGTVLIARSVTADKIAAKSITANEILAGTITGAEIAAETIEGANIKAGTLTTNHVAADFGKTLDLSSNEGITQQVEKIYADMDELIGGNAVGVASVDVWYYLSTSSTALSGGTWQTTAPTWVNGKYFWSKTVTTYTSGITQESSPVCITGAKGATGATGAAGANGTNGTNGADGRGVKSIAEQFYLSTSKTAQSGGSWQSTPPTWAKGKYMWTRSLITYTDGTTATTEPYCDTGWEAANGIQVGGRNLLAHTADIHYEATNATTAVASYSASSVDTIDLANLIGQQITLSATVHTPGEGQTISTDSVMKNRFGTHVVATWADSTGANTSTLQTYPCASALVNRNAVHKRVASTSTLTPPDGYDTLVSLKISIQLCLIPAEDNVETWYIEKPKLELGNIATDWTAAPEDQIEQIAEELTSVRASIKTEADSIRQEVSANYAGSNDLASLKTQVSTMATQTEKNFTWQASRIDELQSGLDGQEATAEQIRQIQTYMTFGTDGLYIGKTGNPFTFRVINDRLAFYMNDTEVAYLSNSKLYVTQAEILTRMQIGKFAFEPQTNGNLSIIYTG